MITCDELKEELERYNFDPEVRTLISLIPKDCETIVEITERIVSELKRRLSKYSVDPLPNGTGRAVLDNIGIFWTPNCEVKDEILVIAVDTMSWFVHPDGTVEYFEGSDEPTERDIIYRNAFSTKKYITLWTMQPEHVVKNWENSGIPPNTYFASERHVALHYWHENSEDYLVEVVLPYNAVIETAESEYKTIRHVTDFKIRRKL